jgi:Fe-Mn family superoxide dismutase
MTYEARTFELPTLKGISAKQVEVHLALYQGYVKHVNLIREKIAELKEADAEGNAYVIAELRRRFPFEFDGMRMHEYYFEQFEGGAQGPISNSPLAKKAEEKYESWNGFIAHIKEVAGSRGIGWTVVYYDSREEVLQTVWVNDHELGQLSGLPVILALDMWEHAFMVDYVPGEKKKYVEAFFENLNWSVIERRMN